MIPCISVANMRESDRKTIETIVPGLTLMYRAAMGVYRAACWTDHTVIAVGGGNNGGDGFALACILQEHGHSCRVVTLSDHLSPDSAHFAEKAKQLGVPVSAYAPGAFSGYGTIVDCLLGTGFAGEVREPYRTAIREINSSGARVISVDIPSGMNGDTGEAVTAVRSDTTVTIGFVKRGLITENAGNYMSHLMCADIGIRLDREEDLICPAEEWSDAVAARGNVFPAPRWLNMRPIDVRDVSYKRMVIETKRLSIHTASRDEMLRYVEAQTDVILKPAYQEMLQGCLDHPDQWEWYSIWMIELKDGRRKQRVSHFVFSNPYICGMIS